MKLTKQILEAVDKGILIALDDYEDNELNGSISSVNDVINAEDVIRLRIDLNKYTVDLGLPSGTRWCKYNLGCDYELLNNYPKNARLKDWCGDYYAWGETIPNKSDGYNWETYQFKKDLIKYNKDHLTELQLVDDPAYLNMHLYNFKFRMPTKELFEELIKETNNEWTSINGVNGYKFTSKLDSTKYIFLPVAGYCIDFDLNGANGEGNYWSSSLGTDYPRCALYLYFDNEAFSMYDLGGLRCYGFSVRPVINL